MVSPTRVKAEPGNVYEMSGGDPAGDVNGFKNIPCKS